MRLSGILLVAVLAVSAAHAADEFLPDVAISFLSKSFSDEQFLRGEAESGDVVELEAVLSLPATGDSHPVVILLHGTDGPRSGAVRAWYYFLRHSGYATAQLDSYGGRAIHQANSDQDAFGQFLQVYDAFRLVETLAADARIDPDKFLLMGFSRGGTAALFGSLERFHELYGPAAGSIVGYLPFYAACNFELVDGYRMVDAPLRAFHGAEDDWASPQACADYVDKSVAAGGDARITIYPGARHGFDSSFPLVLATLHNAQSSFGCMRIEIDGVLVNRDTGRPFTYADDCVTTGPTVRADLQIAAQAQQAVAAFLAEILGRP